MGGGAVAGAPAADRRPALANSRADANRRAGWLRSRSAYPVPVPGGPYAGLRVGVLALQGAFLEHAEALRGLGAEAVDVRLPAHLEGVDALVMPGGESTTMSKLLQSSGLFAPIAARIAAGMPVFGTCAGMILLADDVLDGRPDQRSFAAIGLTVRRNGYGRQLDSFETDLDIAAVGAAAVGGAEGGPFHAVFIRAPLVERVAPGVEVLAVHDGHPVLCRQGSVWAAAFHPELTHDLRIHAAFLGSVEGAVRNPVSPPTAGGL